MKERRKTCQVRRLLLGVFIAVCFYQTARAQQRDGTDEFRRAIAALKEDLKALRDSQQAMAEQIKV